MRPALQALRTLTLPRRAEHLRERMDDPDCDPVRLRRTYRQFGVVNRLLCGWGRLYARRLAPPLRDAARARGVATLLDVGCGGGDVARRLASLAAREGLPLRITAVDPEPRALSYARGRGAPATVRFERADTRELIRAGARFDVVVSNHVLHHLPTHELPRFLDETASLTDRLALHNDLRRSPFALPAFALFSLPFRASFIAEDGLRSIRRAFTPEEAERLAPPGWRVERLAPFRQLLVLARDVREP